MPTYTEASTLQSLEIFPALNVINVKTLNTTLKDGIKFAEQVDARSYSTAQFSDFEMEVAPTGGTLAEIVAGFSQAALDAASALPATLAAKDAELAAAATAHTAALAAKDAEIAALEMQVVALTPAPVEADPLGPVVDDLQIRLAMNQVGLRDAVEAAVAGSGNQSLKDWYERAKKFKRHDPLVIGMVQSLGVPDEDVDALWALAATL